MRTRLFYLAVLTALTGIGWGSVSPTASAQGLLDRFGGLGGQDSREQIVTLESQFTPPSGDQPGRLFIKANIKSGWHIYSITQPPGGPVATKIKLGGSTAYQLAGEFRSSPKPEVKKEPAFDNLEVESHSGSVIWHAPLALAPGVDSQKLRIQGTVQAQPCDASSCLPPRTFTFVAAVGPGMAIPKEDKDEQNASSERSAAVPPAAASQAPAPQPPTVTPEAVPSAVVAAKPEELPWRAFSMASFEQAVGPKFDPELMQASVRQKRDDGSILQMIGLAFVGGLLLNLMPCVLPVIGLKILSFVEQSGQDRRRALALNIWYAAGLMAVFLLLASLAVGFNLGWGHLFKSAGFNVAMASVVFVMALSFLGVWEIPIPGFVGHGRAIDLAEKEGYSGAFAKGVLTTILATPCTGPFMGTALAWAVNQPAGNTYAVFASVGLGMASPYLLIGAFPALIRFLPRPGAWMDTFKQVMGFVLLGTVVYIFTFLESTFIVPTIGLLFALWGAAWWIGRVSPVADLNTKVRAWAGAAAFAGGAWILLFPGIDEFTTGRFAFSGVREIMEGRSEQRFQRQLNTLLSERSLQLVAADESAANSFEGEQTVLLDFTADWCATCKTLEAQVLNTPEIRESVRKNGVVMMQADWTDEAPEVTRFLDWFGFRQVPVVAVFPAGNPNNPIWFTGWYTQRDILDALVKAGPSATAAPTTTLTAMGTGQ